MDKLSVKVFKMDDLSGDYDVDLAGNISMPLIGQLQAANLTTARARRPANPKAGRRNISSIPTSASRSRHRPRMSVTVDGAVREGGSYPVAGPILADPGRRDGQGTTEDANARRVAVFRTIGGQRQAAAFDLTAIRRGQSPDPQIYPGDIVVVDGSSVKATQKQILQSIPLLSIFGPL